MKTNHVGDKMIKLMADEQIWSACSRDGIMSDAGSDLNLGRLRSHPINRMDVAVRWLRRDERFEQGLIHMHDINARPCLLKLFTLKEEFRPDPLGVNEKASQ